MTLPRQEAVMVQYVTVIMTLSFGCLCCTVVCWNSDPTQKYQIAAAAFRHCQLMVEALASVSFEYPNRKSCKPVTSQLAHASGQVLPVAGRRLVYMASSAQHSYVLASASTEFVPHTLVSTGRSRARTYAC